MVGAIQYLGWWSLQFIEELGRITRENMADHLERFMRALEDDGIMPIDF